MRRSLIAFLLAFFGAVFCAQAQAPAPPVNGASFLRIVSTNNPGAANPADPSDPKSWAARWGLGPFAIFDQASYPSAPQTRLGYWKFDTANFRGQAGQMPLVNRSATLVPSWSGSAVSLASADASSELLYNVWEHNGQTNIDCAQGTVRFWFKPNWNSGDNSAPIKQVSLLQVGTDPSGFWSLAIIGYGTNRCSLLQFSTVSNQYTQTYTFQSGALNGAPVNFRSNHWYQIVLAYSPSNIAVYTNSVLLAAGNGIPSQYFGATWVYTAGNGVSWSPPAAAQAGGFSFGCLPGQPCSVNGQLDELETFNYPLAPQAVAAGFPNFSGSSVDPMLDSDYDGRSDLLETLVDGTSPTDPTRVAPCRLGYWRFDSPALMAEQGQLPLSYNNASLASNWNGMALNIGRDPASHVTYWDVFTNGWANINCRQGSLRFWFKPNWSHAPPAAAPFVYLGNSNSALSQWALNVTPSGTISFTTASNGILSTLLQSAPLPFDSGHWMQIVLTYGPTGSALYINGVLAANGAAVFRWPGLADRNMGLVIGNNTAGHASINGQFDEMETFNYQLAPGAIAENFQIINTIDSDLNGVIDYLEDSAAPASRPFLGAPVVVTGTVEAEQFDLGGNGVAYSALAPNPASAYRPTGLLIAPCDDLGLGFCLDQTRAGEWAQYTISVLVPQAYSIETRVAGLGTNGTFECEFTNPGFYTNTGPLTVASTNWTNVSGVVWLTNGTYTMRLRFLGNGSDGAHVGRFNYISIHPWWREGFASAFTNAVSSFNLSTNNAWTDATNNAAVIQRAINTLPAAGGTVLLPAGTYYVSQSSPNEATSAHANAALSIVRNNVEFAGAGKQDTTLIGFNRATTVLSVGQNQASYAGCTNITVRDLTFQAQPHLAIARFTNTVFEMGQLEPGNDYTGHLTIFKGVTPDNLTCNVLISNCQFRHGDCSIGLVYYISNCVVSHCDFTVWEGTNVYNGKTNGFPTNTANTITYNGSVGIFGSGSPDYNVSIIENTFNGNASLTPSTNDSFGSVGTDGTTLLAPDGFIWFQRGENLFIARNTIVNHALEGIQLNGGPSSVVGNTFHTLVNDLSCCALAVCSVVWDETATSDSNYFTCFIGNSVYGGRRGVSPQGATGRPYFVNFSGNELTLYPPLALGQDYPGAAAAFEGCAVANVLGNTLDSGGHGVLFGPGCGSALIMNNNFANADYRSIGVTQDAGAAENVIIANNILGQGVSFHVQLPLQKNPGWFIYNNDCLNTAGQSGPPFVDPSGTDAHVSN